MLSIVLLKKDPLTRIFCDKFVSVNFGEYLLIYCTGIVSNEMIRCIET